MNNPVSTFIAENFFWVLIAVLALNLFQRRKGKASRTKRQATLWWAILVFGLYVAGVLLVQFELSDLFLLIYAAVAAGLVYKFRTVFLPFKLKCVSCRKQMDFNQIFFDDSNLCMGCKEKLQESGEDAEAADDSQEGGNS
jgi:hypothetical protein